MAELKTKKTTASVPTFLNKIADPDQRRDAKRLVALMKQMTRAAPKMWGTSIVGFGSYKCRYASGRECDWFLTGFAPRKGNLSIYVMPGLDAFRPLLARLGKFKAGMGCLYIKSLDDIEFDVLSEIIAESVASLQAKQRK